MLSVAVLIAVAMAVVAGLFEGLSASSLPAVRMVVVGTDDHGVDRRWSAGHRSCRRAALLAAVAVVLSRASRAELSGATTSG
jgi:hypothetical protein